MSDQFSHWGIRASVAAICQSVGFGAIQTTAWDSMADVVFHYMWEVGALCRKKAELANRTQITVTDVQQVLAELGINVQQLEDYLCDITTGSNGLSMPPTLCWPSYPAPKTPPVYHHKTQQTAIEPREEAAAGVTDSVVEEPIPAETAQNVDTVAVTQTAHSDRTVTVTEVVDRPSVAREADGDNDAEGATVKIAAHDHDVAPPPVAVQNSGEVKTIGLAHTSDIASDLENTRDGEGATLAETIQRSGTELGHTTKVPAQSLIPATGTAEEPSTRADTYTGMAANLDIATVTETIPNITKEAAAEVAHNLAGGAPTGVMPSMVPSSNTKTAPETGSCTSTSTAAATAEPHNINFIAEASETHDADQPTADAAVILQADSTAGPGPDQTNRAQSLIDGMPMTVTGPSNNNGLAGVNQEAHVNLGDVLAGTNSPQLRSAPEVPGSYSTEPGGTKVSSEIFNEIQLNDSAESVNDYWLPRTIDRVGEFIPNHFPPFPVPQPPELPVVSEQPEETTIKKETAVDEREADIDDQDYTKAVITDEEGAEDEEWDDRVLELDRGLASSGSEPEAEANDSAGDELDQLSEMSSDAEMGESEAELQNKASGGAVREKWASRAQATGAQVESDDDEKSGDGRQSSRAQPASPVLSSHDKDSGEGNVKRKKSTEEKMEVSEQDTVEEKPKTHDENQPLPKAPTAQGKRAARLLGEEKDRQPTKRKRGYDGTFSTRSKPSADQGVAKSARDAADAAAAAAAAGILDETDLFDVGDAHAITVEMPSELPAGKTAPSAVTLRFGDVHANGKPSLAEDHAAGVQVVKPTVAIAKFSRDRTAVAVSIGSESLETGSASEGEGQTGPGQAVPMVGDAALSIGKASKSHRKSDKKQRLADKAEAAVAGRKNVTSDQSISIVASESAVDQDSDHGPMYSWPKSQSWQKPASRTRLTEEEKRKRKRERDRNRKREIRAQLKAEKLSQTVSSEQMADISADRAEESDVDIDIADSGAEPSLQPSPPPAKEVLSRKSRSGKEKVRQVSTHSAATVLPERGNDALPLTKAMSGQQDSDSDEDTPLAELKSGASFAPTAVMAQPQSVDSVSAGHRDKKKSKKHKKEKRKKDRDRDKGHHKKKSKSDAQQQQPTAAQPLAPGTGTGISSRHSTSSESQNLCPVCQKAPTGQIFQCYNCHKKWHSNCAPAPPVDASSKKHRHWYCTKRCRHERKERKATKKATRAAGQGKAS